MGHSMDRIASQFNIEGTVKSIVPIGNGHINDTYLVVTDHSKYILQRINHHVFKSPQKLMENIKSVTEYLAHGLDNRLCAADHRTGMLSMIPAGDDLFLADSGDYWRMLTYIENSYSCERLTDPVVFGEIGRAYGGFISALSGYPAADLHETIERFHDTRWRFEQFRHACESDILDRAKSALPEISFALEHEKDVDVLGDCVKRGEIPVRVTHNDTKINNILLDKDTGKAVCVIDLDTVMPGLAVNDFGDAIRSGAATGCEDEHDAFKVSLDLDMYKSFKKGFIEGCPALTPKEIEMLPVGAKLMTLECGLRFLTDYLEGDHYFKTSYPGHNLMRCRTQFRLVKDIEEKWSKL